MLFKFVEIVPVPKNSNANTPNDYRPISMMAVLSKVMEKVVVKKWLIPSISDKLHPSQFAYSPGVGKGTSTALTLLYHHIIKFLDNESGAVRLLVADFSKAFDRLTFSSIISSLFRFNFPSQIICFLIDFLRNRKQRVFSGNNVSCWSNITSGVPQGSVIGPLLFSIVIDSFRPICDNSICIKYADDVIIVHLIRVLSDDALQTEWLHLERWAQAVGLHLNYQKSCVMNCVTKKNLSLEPVASTSEEYIPIVTSVKILGVIFSSDLSWNLHVNQIVKKCYRRFFILRNLCRVGCSPDIIHHCYVLFIRSVLLYAFPCFSNLPAYLFKRMLRVERQARKFFIGVDFSDLSVSSDKICVNLVQKIMKNECHPLRVMFQARAPTRRNCSTLRVPRSKTRRFSNSFIRFGTRF